MSRVKGHFEKGYIAWVLLLVLSLGITSWYGFKCINQFYNYQRLSTVTRANVGAWGIEQVKEGQYSVYAKYGYQANGSSFFGKTVFKQVVFPNELAAKEYLNDWKQQSWDVYYDPNQPKHSTLQRNFPVKPGIHFFIGLAVTGYFVYLRRYVLSFNV
jgi:hypothetical protein